MFMQKYTYICWIHTDAMINDARRNNRRQKTSSKNIYLSLYCKGSKRFTQSLRCERELETEHNWNMLTPKLWPSTLCFLVLHGCSTGALLSLLISSISPPTYCLSSALLACLPSVQFVGLTLPSNSHTVIWTRLRNFFRYLATGMCHFRFLWNGLCDRHRAEITIKQVQRSLSSGASVYETIMGFFFYLVPFHQPISAHAISSHNCH